MPIDKKGSNDSAFERVLNEVDPAPHTKPQDVSERKEKEEIEEDK